MTPKEFIDENYFSLTIDCKREINEIYQALKDYAKIEQCNMYSISSCYWEKPKKIELNLENMASGEMIGNIKGLKK
jgi:hypothetical protein